MWNKIYHSLFTWIWLIYKVNEKKKTLIWWIGWWILFINFYVEIDEMWWVKIFNFFNSKIFPHFQFIILLFLFYYFIFAGAIPQHLQIFFISHYQLLVCTKNCKIEINKSFSRGGQAVKDWTATVKNSGRHL